MVKFLYLTFAVFGSLLLGCSKQNAVQNSDTTAAPTAAPASTATALPNAVATRPSAPPFDAKKVSVHNLPDSVEPFVSKYYPGYKIIAASYDPLCGGAPAMDIAIRATGKPAYSVIFLPNGHYVQREQDIPLSSVPTDVKSALKQKYASYRPGRQAERLELVDGSTEYSVDLNKPHNNKEVIFSESGNVLCEGPQ